MLNVLSHADVGDVVAVVTRYYGGTKLGTGGLVRAYGDGVRQALAGLERTVKVAWRRGHLTVAYPFVGAIQRLAGEHGARILDESYTASARFSLDVPEDALAAFALAVEGLTNGATRFEPQ